MDFTASGGVACRPIDPRARVDCAWTVGQSGANLCVRGTASNPLASAVARCARGRESRPRARPASRCPPPRAVLREARRQTGRCRSRTVDHRCRGAARDRQRGAAGRPAAPKQFASLQPPLRLRPSRRVRKRSPSCVSYHSALCNSTVKAAADAGCGSVLSSGGSIFLRRRSRPAPLPVPVSFRSVLAVLGGQTKAVEVTTNDRRGSL
jgi:hypothetical protein